MRLQTYFLVTAWGAKKQGGADLKITDLWLLNSDLKTEEDEKVKSIIDLNKNPTEEHKAWYRRMKQQNNLQ